MRFSQLLLLLLLLCTCGCAQKVAQTEVEPPTTPTTEYHAEAPAEVPGLGSAIPTTFGANMYAPAARVTGDQVLASLQTAFPGKAIYLDMWAVWCMPCIGEFPDSKRLHGETQDLPVEFVYLCTSSKGTQARWESIVKGKEIPGTHVYLDRIAHSEIMDKLRSNAYPNYAVLRADGTYKYDVRRPSELNRGRMERLIK